MIHTAFTDSHRVNVINAVLCKLQFDTYTDHYRADKAVSVKHRIASADLCNTTTSSFTVTVG